MMSSTTPMNLQVTVSMNPFAVVIDSVTYGAKLTNPPVASRPFDLLITCGVDNFMVYADGEAVTTAAIATYHVRNNNLVTPNVFAAEYTITDPAQTKINKISWNFSTFF